MLNTGDLLTLVLSKAKRHNARGFPSFPNLQSYWIPIFVRIDTKGNTGATLIS